MIWVTHNGGLTLIYKDLMSEMNVKRVIKSSLFKMGQLPAIFVVNYIEDDLLGKCRRISTLTLVDTPSGFCVCLQMWV